MEPNGGDQHQVQTELSRDLGLTSALAIGIGTMIAAGIFTLSGLAIRNVGSAAIVSFLLAAFVSLFTALTYCEFVSIYPRSGEGYLYARKTFAAPLAYIVGWALFLGYTASCAFYISSLSSYFVEFIMHTPYEGLSGIMGLVALTLLNMKGTKESGGFQIIVTAAKVVLLIWFVAGGLKFVESQEMIEKFSHDIGDIVSTSALVFITFFGFSAIAASAGEVKNPVKNIPRAIFWSVSVVTLLYTLVVLVTIAANLTEYTEAAMGAAAVKFLGPIGGMVIIAGALFSMISASNASIMAGSRVALSMSQLGHLPKEIGTINTRTKTPIVATLLVGGTIALFTIALPLEDLAHFADTVLLFALIMVNIALIVHRRKFPKMHRPFRVPLVPLLPVLGILANFYLLIQIFHHLTPVLLALASMIFGLIGFFIWKGAQVADKAVPGEASRLALGTFSDDPRDKRMKILVPLANPQTAKDLIRIASAVAKEKNAVVVLLRVATIPAQMPLNFNPKLVDKEKDILDFGRAEVEKYGIPATTLIKIGYNAGKAILETARERNCGLIILGWKGYSNNRDKIFGQVTDLVIKHANCDIMLIKFGEKRSFQRMLLPTAGGEHARKAESYAAVLTKAFESELTLCVVEKQDASEQKLLQAQTRLDDAQERILETHGVRAKERIILNNSVPRGIIKAEDDYDTIVVGATRDRLVTQILFGSIPEMVARYTRKNVIVIKHHNPVKALLGRVVHE